MNVIAIIGIVCGVLGAMLGYAEGGLTEVTWPLTSALWATSCLISNS